MTYQKSAIYFLSTTSLILLLFTFFFNSWVISEYNNSIYTFSPIKICKNNSKCIDVLQVIERKEYVIYIFRTLLALDIIINMLQWVNIIFYQQYNLIIHLSITICAFLTFILPFSWNITFKSIYIEDEKVQIQTGFVTYLFMSSSLLLMFILCLNIRFFSI